MIILRRMAKHFYAVQCGRKTGVYLSWPECEANVKKFPGARYKKFPSEEEAWNFVNSDGSYTKTSNVMQDVTCSYTGTQPKKNSHKASILSSVNNCWTNQKRALSEGKTVPGHERKKYTSASYVPSSSVANVSQIKRHFKHTATAPSTNNQWTTNKRPLLLDGTEPASKRKKSGVRNASSSSSTVTGDRVDVYTDGACSLNGRVGARAGLGVYWPDHEEYNISERLAGKQTNQRAELMAAVRALETAKDKNIYSVTLYTDSKYTMKCVTDWMPRWKRNGWKTIKGTDVLNREEVVKLDILCQDVDVQWEYVPGHRNITGNERADRLAVSGANKRIEQG